MAMPGYLPQGTCNVGELEGHSLSNIPYVQGVWRGFAAAVLSYR